MARFHLSAQLRLTAPSAANTQRVLRQVNTQLSNGVTIDVKLNTAGAQTQLKNLTKTLNSARSAAADSADSMEEFGKQAARSIRHFGAFTVATTAFISLIGAVRKGVSDAIEFDRQMVRIAQVTNSNVSNLRALRAEITRVSKATGVAASSLAEVSVTLAQAGISARDVAKAVDTLAKTELAATFGDISDTTEASIAIMRQFGVQADQLEEKLGSVNRVSAAFAVEAEDITAAVSRAGGSFAAAGGNFEEFISLLTSVRQTTRASAESISTGFNTIFARLQRFRTQDSLEKLGIQLRFTADEAKKLGDAGLENQFVGPFEAVKRLSDALSRLRGSDPRFAQIVEELGGYRQIRNVIPLIQQFGVSQKALNIAIAGGNSLNKDAATAQQALAVQIAKVREEFSALIRKISENEGFRTMIQTILKMASAAIRLVDALEPLLPMLVAFGGFGAGKATGRFFKGFKENVFKFNSGGLVPGSGPNKDTVPATLTKGEYVLRRSAVKNIGIDRLDALNSGRVGLNSGGSVGKAGRVHYEDGSNGGVKSILPPDKLSLFNTLMSQVGDGKKSSARTADAVTKLGSLGISPDKISLPKLGTALDSTKHVNIRQKAFADAIGGTVNAKRAKQRKKRANKKLVIDNNGAPIFGGYFLRGGESGRTTTSFNKKSDGVLFDAMVDNLSRAKPGIASRFANVNEIQVPLELDVINKKTGNLIHGRMKKGFTKLIIDTAKRIGETELKPFTKNFKRLPLDSIAGAGFEGVIASFEKEPFDSGNATQTFDFPHGQVFPELFPEAKPGIIRDAKLTKSKSAIRGGEGSIRSKIKAVLTGTSKQISPARIMKGFNTGGSAEDTVPAMLTPGEYVINRKAAQKIGISNLDRMNKAQHFNRGGVVKMASGGQVPARAEGSNIGEAFNTFALLSILQTLVGSFGELGEGVQESVDVFSGVVVQFVALKAVLGELPFDRIAGGLDNLSTSIAGAYSVIDNAVKNPLGQGSPISRLGGSIAAGRQHRRVARGQFNRFSASGQHTFAGNAFATGFGLDPSAGLGKAAHTFGTGRSLRRGAKLTGNAAQLAAGRRLQLRGVGQAITLGNENSFLGNRDALRSGNPLARGRALKRVGGSLRAAGGVGLAGTLAAGAITDLRESNARKRIAKGDIQGGRADLESASLQGGLAQGAIGGAAAGFVVGGPLGAAVGAVAGTLAATATEFKPFNDFLRTASAGLIDLQTSSEKAAGAVAQFEIGQRSDNIAKNVKSFGLAGSSAERASIGKNIIQDFGKNLRESTSDDEDVAQAAQESLGNNAGDLRSVFESALKSGDAKSVDDLSKVFGPGTTAALSEIAKIEGIDLDLIIREFNTLGQTAARATKIQAAYTQAQLEAQRQILKIRDFNTAINQAVDSVNRFSDNIGAFDTGDIKIPDISGLIERASKGELTRANEQTLNAAGARIAATVPGGDSIVRGAQVEANAVKLLPQILNKARQSSPFGEEMQPEVIKDAFRDALSDGQNTAEVNSFIEQLGGIIEDFAKVENPNSNTAESLEPQNILKFQEAIMSAQINLKAFGDVASSQANIAQSLKQKADRRLEIEQQYIDMVNSSVDARASVEKDLAVLAGGGTDKRSLEERNSFADARINNILGGTGFGAQSDPKAIAQEAIGVKNSLAQLEAQINAQGGATAGQISQYETLRDKLGRFERAISETAENTDKYANTLEELNKLESERTNRRDKALGFAFGSNEERLSQSKDIAAVAKVVAGGFNKDELNNNEELRQSFLRGSQFLEGTGVKITDPRSGKALDSAAIQNEALKSLGFGAGITSPGDMEKQKVDLLKQIADNTQRAREAQGVINRANFDANGRPLGRHSGGPVPGIGNTDSVSALLTPGEFVMRKEAVSRIGLTKLSAMNSGRQRFAEGGLVQPQSVVNIQGLDASVARFVQATNVLAQSLSTFPSEITGSFTVKHEHIFNGLEVLSRMEPMFREMTTKLIEDKLQKFVDDKLPDLGRVNGF